MASNKIRVGVIKIQAIALSDNPLKFFTALFIYKLRNIMGGKELPPIGIIFYIFPSASKTSSQSSIILSRASWAEPFPLTT
jgi:hypothetical protein